MWTFRRPPAPPPRACRPADPVTDEPPAGCGWFESSHELRRGLVVQEHASCDSVSAQTSLADWLLFYFASARHPETEVRDDRALVLSGAGEC